jgi:ribosomal protein S2
MEETTMVDLNATLERLAAAAEALERAVAKQNEVTVEAQASIARIVAEAETKLTHPEITGRKTVTAGTAMMLSKQGVDVGAVTLEAAAIDGALAHLSVEQRIAVKAELMRAGLL